VPTGTKVPKRAHRTEARRIEPWDDDKVSDPGRPLSRTEASRAVEAAGWRYLLGNLCASVPVSDLAEGVAVARVAAEAAGEDADTHLRIDVRPDRVELSLQTRDRAAVTARDTELAQRISAALGLRSHEVAPARSARYPRPVQMLEVAIDAVDIAAVRPFWKAVLALEDQPGEPPETGALVDPAGQLPAVWFQQMDEPRTDRNRIHFDVTVADDEAEARVAAALAAGGRLVNDAYARMFWVLADIEGNEVCVCTWTDRDEWDERFGAR
jgi:4a-hydroxytetrahydrobiopterin dehydratase